MEVVVIGKEMEVGFDEDEGFAEILHDEKVAAMLLTDVAIAEMKWVWDSVNGPADENGETQTRS